MKVLYVKDLVGEPFVLFVDENDKAYYLDGINFDEKLTLEIAKNADYSGCYDDEMETADECQWEMGCYTDHIIDFNENDYCEIIDITNDIK